MPVELAIEPSTIDFTFVKGKPEIAGCVDMVAMDAQSVNKRYPFKTVMQTATTY